VNVKSISEYQGKNLKQDLDNMVVAYLNILCMHSNTVKVRVELVSYMCWVTQHKHKVN